MGIKADNVPAKLAISIMATVIQLNAKNDLPVEVAIPLSCPNARVVSWLEYVADVTNADASP